MITTNPFYISAKGGSITCFRGDSGRVFRSCSRSCCVYSTDLHSAKAHLDNLEGVKNILSGNINKIPAQRKTTLKWNSDGELSAVDMTRILDRLANSQLTECDLTCNVVDPSPDRQDTTFYQGVPISSWLP